MLNIVSRDPRTKRGQDIDPAGAAHVSVRAAPLLEPQRIRFFRQYLTIEGTPAGDNDMGISGAVTPVEFFVPASQYADRFITNLSFSIVCGAQPEMWEFADANTALANGIRLYYTDTNKNEVDIHDAMVSNWDIVRLARGTPTISGGKPADAFVARNVAATTDWGLIPNVDLSAYMPPYGVKLDKGTMEKIALVINDDCTDADTFNVLAFGFDRFPDPPPE